MKFLANENLPRRVVDVLKKKGFDFMRVDEIRKGMSDFEVIELAIKEQRILVTFDKDFGELVFNKRYKVRGIVLLRLMLMSIDFIVDKFLNVITKLRDLENKFVVIENEKIRIREL